MVQGLDKDTFTFCVLKFRDSAASSVRKAEIFIPESGLLDGVVFSDQVRRVHVLIAHKCKIGSKSG